MIRKFAFKSASFAILIFILSICDTLAQSDIDYDMELSLVCLEVMPSSLLLQTGNGDFIAVAPLPGMRSPSIKYSGANPLCFFIEKTDAEGRMKRIPVAKVPFQSDWRRVLVVLTRKRGSSAELLNGQAFDDSPSAFPAGRIRVFNHYSLPMAIRSGSEAPVKLESGQSTIQLLSVDGTGRAFIQLAVSKAGSWQAITPLGTDVLPNMRALAFFYEDGGKMERTLILDIVDTENAQEQNKLLHKI